MHRLRRAPQDNVDQLAHLELMAVREIEESVEHLDSREIVEQRYENIHVQCVIL